MGQAEEEGNKERAAMTSKKMDEIDAEMQGMKKALEIFGYTVIYQDGINKVVLIE